MMSTTAPKYPVFDLYAESLAAAERAMEFWGELYRTSADLALWWAGRWMELPSAFAAYMPKAPSAEAREIMADAAEAAAAAFAAPVLEALTVVPEAPEPAAEPPPAAAPDADGADDLTRLVGVGPRVAALLAERGVTRFAQIAAWTDEEAARMDRELNLMGRIARQGWVSQARQFAENA
jgi:predicted flap endonuclease-1-like 5' DNA nuclease